MSQEKNSNKISKKKHKLRNILLSFFLISTLLLFVGIGSIFLSPAPQVKGYVLKNAVNEISYNAPIKITFDQWMDKASVEKNFKIEPEVSGKIQWEQNTLLFVPDNGFQIGDSYQVSIGKEAKSIAQKALNYEYQEIFVATKSPEVILITPKNGSEEIETDSKITVMFDRPITVISSIENTARNFPDLIIEPKTAGEFRWLGSTSFQFIPRKLESATTYKITVPKNTLTLDGGKTEKEFETVFQTERPTVLQIESEEGNEFFSVDSKMIIDFNMPIDFSSAKENIKLMQISENKAEEISIDITSVSSKEFAEIQKKRSARIDMGFLDEYLPDSSNVVFENNQSDLNKKALIRPKQKLEFNGNYQIVIKEGLRAANNGDLVLSPSFSYDFKVIDGFKLSYIHEPKPFIPIAFEFTSPINLQSFKNKITIDPKFLDEEGKEIQPSILISDDNILVINNSFAPSTDYTITIEQGVKDIFGNQLTEKIVHLHKEPARKASLTLKTGTDLQILDATKKPIFYLQSTNVDKAQIQLSRLFLSDLMNMYEGGYLSKKVLPAEKQIQYADIIIENELNKTVFTSVDLSKLFPDEDFLLGIFFLEISAPGITDQIDDYYYFYEEDFKSVSTVFMATKTAVAVKKSKDELLLWVTGMDTGKPVEGMSMMVFGEEKMEATTDKDGLAKIKIPKEKQGSYNDYNIVGYRGDDFTFVNSGWSEGILPWNFNIEYDLSPQKYFMYLYTDRPIYRPGHEVFFKGILRVDEDVKFKLPKVAKSKLEVFDPLGEKIYEELLEISENGTLSGNIVLPMEVKTGYYYLKASVEDDQVEFDWQKEFYSGFRVAEYKKPEYKLDISASAKEYLNRQTALIEVNGQYFFGAPLAGNKYSWKLRSMDYYFWLPEAVLSYYPNSWFSFNEEGYFCYFGCAQESSFLIEGEGNLDQNGKSTINIPLNIKDKKSSQIMTLEVTVYDKNNQSVSNRTSFVTHKGDFYLGVRSKNYLANVGEKAEFEALTIKSDGQALVGTSVQAELFERTWNTVKRKNLDGFHYYENSYEDKSLEKKNIRTGQKGLASFDFEFKKGGNYLIKVSSKDSMGNIIIASTSIFVGSREFINWGRNNNDRIELVADKNEYKPGETAKIMIKSPYDNYLALVTRERAGVINAELFEGKSNSETIEIPITENDMPNSFVSVLLVKGSNFDGGLLEPVEGEKDERSVATFKVGYTVLHIGNENKKLNIEINQDKEKYLPGEDVTITLKTTDSSGNPIKSELSVGVVDESVLSLSESFTADLINSFYRKRYLSVVLAHNLTKAISRINVQVEAGMKGGGGGNEGKRGEFKDTAFFAGSVKTDQNGEATITFKLPDNLTTWEILAIGISDENDLGTDKETKTLVGSVKKSFITSKNLLLRPVLPRFLTESDKVTIGAITHNYLTKTQNVTVSIKSNLNQIFDERKITLKPGEAQKTEWYFELEKDAPYEAAFEISAVTQGFSDIVIHKIPVYKASFPEYVSNSGVIEDTNKYSQTIWIPTGIAKSKVTITFSPSLAGSLQNSFEYLAQFPYGCTEQLASAIIPNAALKKLSSLKMFSLSQDQINEIEKNVSEGLQSLYRNQRANGSFGLFAGSPQNAYVTAYALYAMHLSANAGFQANQNAIQKSATFLNTYFKNNPLSKGKNSLIDANTRAMAIFVLSEMEKAELSLANNLFDTSKDNLNLFAKAQLAMAFDNLSKKVDGAVKAEIQRKILILKNDLINSATHSDRGVIFEENESLFQLFDTNLRSTAIVLQALNRIDENNPLISKTVNMLLSQRQAGKYSSTQENAIVLLSILEYLQKSNELNASFDAFVELNGKESAKKSFTSDNILSVESFELSSKDFLNNNADNLLSLWKNGKGKLYHDLTLEYYLPYEKVVSINKGFETTQEYFALDDKKKEKPLKEFILGETYLSKMNVIVPNGRHYAMIEDYLPAGFEAVDFSLKTSEQFLNEDECDIDYCYQYDFSSSWYFNHQEIRDNRVMYFADYLPEGVYELEYYVRASTSGDFVDLPVMARETYYPDVFGHNEAKRIVIHKNS